jgi:hypothetical protein
MVIILYAEFFLEAMDKYKKKVLRKSFQHRINSLTGQRGEKSKNSRKLRLKLNPNLGLKSESYNTFNTKQGRLTKASRFCSVYNTE